MIQLYKPSEAACAIFNAFTFSSDDWVQISPYGDFPHPKGLQRVDRTAAQTMVNAFESLAAQQGNQFRGLPFYIGHPDGPPPICDRWPDKSAKGWIKKLQARDNGFYGQVKWNPRGQEIIANAEFMYLSPAWFPEPITSAGARMLRPAFLKSVGFVNDPNISVMPLANSAESRRDYGADRASAERQRRANFSALVNTAMSKEGMEYTEAFIATQRRQKRLGYAL